MKIIVKHENGTQYYIVAMNNKKGICLLEDLNLEAYTRFVVAISPNENQNSYSWEHGFYFKEFDDAYDEYLSKISEKGE